MKFFKPAWINHNGLPICSIDVHPDGSRVATGGQGEDSGRVVIWNMEPVVSEEKENNKNVPKVLCQLDNHLACVNCVRWNMTGKLLASGGDDKLVMLWAISKTSGSLMSQGESWRCVATLRGHDGDVIDMAWSPSSAWLATCSVDNSVIVWNAASTPPCIQTTLRGHSGLVKGVAWDPVGTYLATQADDKSVRIWRTTDWHLETSVTSPFAKCSGTTMVLRLSWSPDGLYLVTAHAMNGPVPTAQIIDRESWIHDNDFVGHHMAVTCVRFSRDIMEVGYKESGEGRLARSCCVILGSRDRGLSVWMTCLKRPVVVVENVFESPVNDITWGPGGLSAMACSTDGTVAYVEFSSTELGRPISQNDKDQVLHKLYGKSACEPDGGLALLENPDILELVDGHAHTSPRPASPHMSHNSVGSSCGGSKQSTPPMTKQIETRRADGRRRITPIFIPPSSSEMGDEVGPFSSDTNTTPFSMSVPVRANIVPDEMRSATLPAPSTLPVTSSPVASAKVTNDISGFGTLSTVSKKVNVRKMSETPVIQNHTEVSKVAGNRILMASKKDFNLCTPVSCNLTKMNRLSGTSDWLSVEKSTSGRKDKNLTIVKRFTGPSPPTIGQPALWTYALSSSVDLVVGEGPIAILAAGSSLHLLDTIRGMPLVPPLALSSPISYLSLTPIPNSKKENLLLCISVDGKLYGWKVLGNSIEGLFYHISLDPVLPYSPDGSGVEVQIKHCFLSDKNDILLALSNGKCYLYSEMNKCWMLIGDENDPVIKASGVFKSAGSHASSLPLRRIFSAAGTTSPAVDRTGILGAEAARACQETRIKGAMAAALAVASPIEYRLALVALINYLLDQGDEKQLKQIMLDLLGPCHSTPGLTPSWEPTVLGLNKRELLQSSLRLVGKNLRMQRLYTEFKQLLELAPNSIPAFL